MLATSDTILFLNAANTGDTETVRDMLNKGIDPNSTIEYDGIGLSAVHYAAGHGHHETLSLLLACGAYTNQVSLPPHAGLIALHLAIDAGSLECVELLVKYGEPEDLHFRAPNGLAPIELAMKLRRHTIAKYLACQS